MNFDEVCELLSSNGIKRRGIRSKNKAIYVNKDKTLSVVVSEIIKDTENI